MRRLAAAALVAAALAPAAHASAERAVFGLRAGADPRLGYFVYRLGAGGTRSGSVIVSNVGTAAGTVRLFTADGATGSTSGTVYRTDRTPVGAGSWVTLGGTEVTLAPGQSATVPFTVRVPASAPSGQWVAGIAAESPQTTAQAAEGKSRVRINVRSLTIVAVQVDVAGPTAAGFRIGSVRAGGSHGYQQLLLHLAGTGNALTKPRGSVTITRTNGSSAQTLRYTMDTFLPHTAIDYPVTLKRALGPGRYTADIVLRARPLSGGRLVVVRARRAFSIDSTQLKRVFSTAPPTTGPPAGSSWTTVGAAAGGAAAALAVGGVVLLVLRRRPAHASA